MDAHHIQIVRAIVAAELTRIDRWERHNPTKRHVCAERQRELTLSIAKAAGALSVYGEGGHNG